MTPFDGAPKLFTAKQRDILIEYLSRPAIKEAGAYTLPELKGFFFAVATAPAHVAPSDWLPVVFGGELPTFATHRESDQIVNAMLSLYNSIVDDVMEGNGRLPEDIVLRDDPMDNLDVVGPVSQWSLGLWYGHSWLEDDWVKHGIEGDDTISNALWVLWFFITQGVAEDFAEELDMPLTACAEQAHRRFHDAAADYVSYGIKCRKARIGKEDPGAIRLRVDTSRLPVKIIKASRNEPCPCGSGRKHKKCCGLPA